MRLPIGYKHKYANIYKTKVGTRKREGKLVDIYGRVLTAEERAEWHDRLERIMERQPMGRKFTLEDV